MLTRPNTATPNKKTRRWLLTTLGLSPILATGTLAGCGDGNDGSTSITRGLTAQGAANAAVAQGIVGALCQHVSTSQSDALDVGIAGLRRLGHANPVQASDPFAIGSTTKAMTAMLAARLVDQGRLGWESTLEQMLPMLAPDMLPVYRTVTLRQLLAHKGGLMALQSSVDVLALVNSFQGDVPSALSDQRTSFARWVLAQQPPIGITPGRDYAYSNAGYTVVGVILEAHSGQSFEDFFNTQLVTPLGLKNPWRDLFNTPTPPVTGHIGSPGKLAALTQTDELANTIARILAPAGTVLRVSAADYGLWLQWHLRALAGETTPLPTSYIAALRMATHGEYLLGWVPRKQQPVPALVHDGTTMGFQALTWVDLDGKGAGHLWANCTEGDGTPWVSTILIGLLERMGQHYRT